jgi:hypothetical protein
MPLERRGANMADSHSCSGIRRHLALLYPLLWLILPVLYTVAYQPGKASLLDLLLICSGLIAAFGLLYLVLARSVGNHPLASFYTFTAVVWFFLFPYAQTVLLPKISPFIIAGFGGLVTAASLFWFGRHPGALDVVSRLLARTSVLLVAWQGLRIVSSTIEEHRAIESSTFLRRLAEPIATESDTIEPTNRPSIYLIVLDEYANSEVLRRHFGFDNHEMEDSLRQLGFFIPRLVRSNYLHTTLSLPSLLNFTHLTAVARELGPESDDPTLLNRALEDNRTVRFLRSRGYRFEFFPSEWWPSTAHNPNADCEHQNPVAFTFWGNLARTELRRGLWKRSLLRYLGPTVQSVDAEYLKETFHGLARSGSRGQPTFIFDHVLLPHKPYVFDERCRTIVAPDFADRTRYVGQLRCANAQILQVVTRLLRESPHPPIILLQGDHGTNILKPNSEPTPQRISVAQAKERFGAFGAYYLPGGGQWLGDTLTLVNLLPKVLEHYFQVNLPPIPDDLFVSLLDKPLEMVQVEPSRLR